MVPILRVVRPTSDLDPLVRFYGAGLGFEILSRFEAAGGLEAAIMGHPRYPYHFAFTRYRGRNFGRAPSPDNLLVFYLPDAAEYQGSLARMAGAGYAPAQSFNPYWDEGGLTFEDPDGYRVVLTSRTWQR